MFKCFIAYFDLLGFKDFILNNENEYLQVRMGHVLRDIEIALSQGNYRKSESGFVLADISKSKVNCINFSDTIIFWTNDCSIESFEQILKVAHELNWRLIFFNFPAKSVIVCDEIRVIDFKQKAETGAVYNINSLYGKGIVNAYVRTDSLSWAGSVIDSSAIDQLGNGESVISLCKQYAKLYTVPYKFLIENQIPEYALKLIKEKLNQEAYNNYSNNIKSTFERDNKRIDSPRVQLILQNTLKYLQTFND